jgi:hypothetical protein
MVKQPTEKLMIQIKLNMKLLYSKPNKITKAWNFLSHSREINTRVEAYQFINGKEKIAIASQWIESSTSWTQKYLGFKCQLYKSNW